MQLVKRVNQVDIKSKIILFFIPCSILGYATAGPKGESGLPGRDGKKYLIMKF